MQENDKRLARKLGALIRLLRIRAGLSRSNLASRANVSEATLKNLESGRFLPNGAILLRLLSVPRMGLDAARIARMLGEETPQFVSVDYYEGPLRAELPPHGYQEAIGTVLTIRMFIVPPVICRDFLH